jgi:hypothetical protein
MKNYPKFDGKSYKYVKHPVLDADLWFAADVTEDSYFVSPLANAFANEAECQKACDCHNSYEGWSKDEANRIIGESMGLDKL